MKKFKIKYYSYYYDVNFNEIGNIIEVVKEFQDTENISAYEWAEDYAYAIADKGTYYIEEIT